MLLAELEALKKENRFMLTNCQFKAYFEIQRACEVTLKNILISYPQRMELLGRQPLCLILSGMRCEVQPFLFLS